MKKSKFTGTYTLIWSLKPDQLMKFYRDILELPLNSKINIPARAGLEKDYGYEFILTQKNDKLWIGHHSKIHKKNTEGIRIMHNLYTDEVSAWHKKLVKSKVKIIQAPIKTPFYSTKSPWYVCTFCDPEGNMWQLMGKL